MKTLLRAAFMATLAAGVLGAATTFAAERHFPNADRAFGLQEAVAGVEGGPSCGTYVDSYRLIGETAQESGYHDPYRMIGGGEETRQARTDESLADQGRIACREPVGEEPADRPL